MKWLSVFTLIFSVSAHANYAPQVEPQALISVDSNRVITTQDSPWSTEAGVTVSSIRNGTTFASASLLRDMTRAFQLGLRGHIPMNFSDDLKVYEGEVLARWKFHMGTDTMALEGTFTQAIESTDGNAFFGLIGASYSYFRKFSPELSGGIAVGADYKTNGRTALTDPDGGVYSRLAFLANYDF